MTILNVNGTNLKNYIEELLHEMASNYEDAKIYAKLSKEQPEGLKPVSKEEQEDFERQLTKEQKFS